MKKQTFNIGREKRNEMVQSIKRYFEREREESIGDLAAGLLLDFFADELAAEFYNQGVYDSYMYMNNKVEDLMGIQK